MNKPQAIRAIETLIAGTNGRFFTVTFVKKDGTVRVMNCRTGVKKYIKGTSTVNRSINDVKSLSTHLNVWDAVKRGYRSINKATIQSATIDGITIMVK